MIYLSLFYVPCYSLSTFVFFLFSHSSLRFVFAPGLPYLVPRPSPYFHFHSLFSSYLLLISLPSLLSFTAPSLFVEIRLFLFPLLHLPSSLSFHRSSSPAPRPSLGAGARNFLTVARARPGVGAGTGLPGTRHDPPSRSPSHRGHLSCSVILHTTAATVTSDALGHFLEPDIERFLWSNASMCMQISQVVHPIRVLHDATRYLPLALPPSEQYLFQLSCHQEINMNHKTNVTIQCIVAVEKGFVSCFVTVKTMSQISHDSN